MSLKYNLQKALYVISMPLRIVFVLFYYFVIPIINALFYLTVSNPIVFASILGLSVLGVNQIPFVKKYIIIQILSVLLAILAFYLVATNQHDIGYNYRNFPENTKNFINNMKSSFLKKTLPYTSENNRIDVYTKLQKEQITKENDQCLDYNKNKIPELQKNYNDHVKAYNDITARIDAINKQLAENPPTDRMEKNNLMNELNELRMNKEFYEKQIARLQDPNFTELSNYYNLANATGLRTKNRESAYLKNNVLDSIDADLVKLATCTIGHITP